MSAEADGLFDEPARALAAAQSAESHFRWLALSDDPEAVALRAALERCLALAGAASDVLRKGLAHERWGQHAGALAHLLALGMLHRQGLALETEPPLGRQSPDVLATRRDGLRLLVEVRSITGAGHFPWEARRAAGRTLAQDPAKHATVRASVAKVLRQKADTYRPLVRRLGLPYAICLYEDKDSVLGEIVRDLAFGRAPARDGARDPRGGLFAGDREAYDHVSAVIVFGRLDTDDGALRLVGDAVQNPLADAPLALPDALPLLRAYRRVPPGALDGRMAFADGATPRPFALGAD